MAFTGVAVIRKLSESCFRITGLSLAAAAAGTIGIAPNATAEVDLQAPEWDRYVVPGLQGGEVELDAAVEVSVICAEAGLAVVENPSVVKTGDGRADFLVTITNPDAAASGALEIYVKFHGG